MNGAAISIIGVLPPEFSFDYRSTVIGLVLGLADSVAASSALRATLRGLVRLDPIMLGFVAGFYLVLVTAAICRLQRRRCVLIRRVHYAWIDLARSRKQEHGNCAAAVLIVQKNPTHKERALLDEFPEHRRGELGNHISPYDRRS